jgi:hypothetical protein
MEIDNKFIKLHASCIIYKEYLAYLIIRRDKPLTPKFTLMPNFMFIKDEIELIKRIYEKGNIKYNCKEDLEDVKPLLLNVLIKLVKQEINEIIFKCKGIKIEDADFNFNDVLHLNGIRNKLDFLRKIKENLDINLEDDNFKQINLRIYILQHIEKDFLNV